MESIRAITKKLLLGGRIPAYDGTTLYTPDGEGFYAALWVRDFAYTLQSAGEMIPPADMKRAIEYVIRGARPADGWIPDRIEPDGTSRYTAGDESFPASPNLDTGPYLVLCADVYLRTPEDAQAKQQFLAWQAALERGLACLPVDENHLIANFADPPHSGYGFVDCIRKTGLLAMESLLYWESLGVLANWAERCGQDAAAHREKMARIEKAFPAAFLSADGLILASTVDCRQIDVWANCYAVSVGFPIPHAPISDWLIRNYDSVVEAGQIRHLPKGESWQRTFVPVAPGEYQNGACWATATHWFCDAIGGKNPALARKTVRDAIAYFEKYGVFECVNGNYRKLDTFVASAVNVYAAAKRWL